MLKPSGARALLPVTAVLIIVVAGATLRGARLLASDFPLNDGGMFALMADELRTNEYALPLVTAYNQASIPFAYPPLALYIAAAVSSLGFETTDALRWLPLLFSTMTISVVYLIARQVLRRRNLAIVAAATFAFTTGSYQWLVMGGGLTRSLGFLMALVAISFAVRMYRSGDRWAVVSCGAALGAAALSHPQAAVFAGLSTPVLLPFTTSERGKAVRRLLGSIAVAVLVTLPWLATVVLAHGISPFVSALGTGGGVFLGVLSLASSRTSGGYLEIIGIATTFALVICLIRRFWLPPVWILAIAIADSRAGQPYIAVPAALAIAFLLGDIGRMIRRSVASRPSSRWAPEVTTALAVLFIVAAFFDSLASQSVPGSPLRVLPDDTRAAMGWVEGETKPADRFVVLSGNYWAMDAEAEWFPALAKRHSVNTVQGSEWRGTYDTRIARAWELTACVVRDDQECLAEWFDNAGNVDYLFLVDTPPREIGGVLCCHQLAEQLSTLYVTEVVHREGPVIVVRLTPRSG